MIDTRFRVRPCRWEDLPAAYDVCLQTGDSGADGTLLYADDPDALGRLFVGPYVQLCPEFAFVLEDEQGVCGYVLAALDTAAFFRRFVEEWLPGLHRRVPRPTGDPAGWTPAQRVHHEYYVPDLYHPDSSGPYPSHLHIDLVARAQGCGWGARLMAFELGLLAAKGSPGAHLGLSAKNQRAERFYRKLGFEELERRPGDPPVIYLGRRLP